MILGLLAILAGLCLATVILESIPVLFVRNKTAWWKAGLLCNVITNPILNLVMFLVTAYVSNDNAVTAILLALEGIVVLTEAYFYHRMLGRASLTCFVFSLIANALSYSTGMIFFSL